MLEESAAGTGEFHAPAGFTVAFVRSAQRLLIWDLVGLGGIWNGYFQSLKIIFKAKFSREISEHSAAETPVVSRQDLGSNTCRLRVRNTQIPYLQSTTLPLTEFWAASCYIWCGWCACYLCPVAIGNAKVLAIAILLHTCTG